MTTYRVNDIYSTVQGEGCQTGLAMVLLRLHGCGVGCPWCDTKETWIADPKNAKLSIAEALGANPHYALAEAITIVEYIAAHHPGPNWIMLTGGEPADQDLHDLVSALHRAGYKVAIETSGTALGLMGAGCDWVCVSPKIGMPGGREVLALPMAMADEIKMVIGKREDLTKLDQLLDRCPPRLGAQICLQPLSQSRTATKLCIETVQARGWRLSVQMHKYMGLA